jgi:hypothetical protein
MVLLGWVGGFCRSGGAPRPCPRVGPRGTSGEAGEPPGLRARPPHRLGARLRVALKEIGTTSWPDSPWPMTIVVFSWTSPVVPGVDARRFGRQRRWFRGTTPAVVGDDGRRHPRRHPFPADAIGRPSDHRCRLRRRRPSSGETMPAVSRNGALRPSKSCVSPYQCLRWSGRSFGPNGGLARRPPAAFGSCAREWSTMLLRAALTASDLSPSGSSFCAASRASWHSS